VQKTGQIQAIASFTRFFQLRAKCHLLYEKRRWRASVLSYSLCGTALAAVGRGSDGGRPEFPDAIPAGCELEAESS
jgi:sulfite exporter TauE/SafE